MKFSRVESLIIAVFLLCVALWAISKCSSKRSQTVRSGRAELEEEDIERPQKRDTVYVPQPQAQPQSQTEPAPAQPQTYSAPPPKRGLPKLGDMPAEAAPAARPALTNDPPPAKTEAETPKYSTLFVTIDGLNMRKEPNKKSALVARLDLYEQVYFLNKKSEKPEEINLGLEKVTDYWVKVRTKSGKDGWVFGAGVHYYKTKRKGVLE